MSESILIVDDERGIRETLSAVLRDEGFNAEAVESGEECLKAIARRAYGCVLLDVWLPGISGLETLQQMRDANSDVAVVIISGHGNVETAVPLRLRPNGIPVATDDWEAPERSAPIPSPKDDE